MTTIELSSTEILFLQAVYEENVTYAEILKYFSSKQNTVTYQTIRKIAQKLDKDKKMIFRKSYPARTVIELRNSAIEILNR